MMTLRVFAALLLVLGLTAPAAAQKGVAARTLTVGPTPALPEGSSTRLDGLGTSGGTNVLFADGDGDIFERLLAASDIPSTFTQRNVAESISSAWTFSGGLLVPNGSADTPSVRFSGDTNTGLYRVGADSVGLSAGGSVRLTVDTSATTVAGDLAVNGNDITSTGVLRITPTGNLTLDPTGDIVLDPDGHDILPSSGYTKNLGALSNKYLTLHAAELWVETLVAQDTIATIGGRVLVGPTTTLTADLTTGETTITVKHNQLASGDRVYLEAEGKVEFMAITSGASGSGPYTYTVTRNLDGSGANQWYAGDAMFNTGTTGDGFIDLYSVSGVLSGNGPTIVGNVRTGSTYSAVAPRWAIGNLNGLYGYGADTYGAAFGNASDVWLGVDATNGVRILEAGSTVRAQWATDGSLTIGDPSTNSGNVHIASNAISLRSGTQTRINLAASNGEMNMYDPGGTPRVTIGSNYAIFGRVDTGQPNILITPASGLLELRGGTLTRISLSAVSGEVNFNDPSGVPRTTIGSDYTIFGRVASGQPNILITPSTGDLAFRVGTTNKMVFTAAGAIQQYDPSGYLRTFIGDVGGGTPGVILGRSDVANVPFVQITDTSLQFCQAGVGCPLAFIGTTGDITSNGSLQVGASGHIRGGATAYNSGTGFWLGNDGGTYKFRVGTTAGNRLTWDGSALTVAGDGSGLVSLAGGNITAGSITATQIAGGTITAAKIASGTITASEIASGTITATQIASGTITATQIAAGTITATQLAAGTITADKLNVTSLSAVSGNLGTITGGSLSIGGNFSVTSGGVLTASGSTLASLTVTGGASFGSGSGPNIVTFNIPIVIGAFVGGGSTNVCADNSGFLYRC